jgi:hypothetical protein
VAHGLHHRHANHHNTRARALREKRMEKYLNAHDSRFSLCGIEAY